MPKKATLLQTIEVGPEKEIDNGFIGTIEKLKMKRLDAIKKAQEFQKQVEVDPIEGMISLLSELERVYPKVDLTYGEHKFKSIEDLYETDVGEELIISVLMPKVAGATQISKN